MRYLRIHDWEEWQSYRKDRGQPPWIKVHRSIMRDPKWVSLTDKQRGHLVLIWLLAADRDGDIPSDAKMIQKLCFMDSPPDLKLLIDKGFIDDDANMTPERRQYDANMTHQKRGEENRREEKTEHSFPFLESQFPRIIQALKSQKPTAKISTNDTNQLKGLSDLVRLDDYSERDVVGCLIWVFTSPDKDAVFWCKNVSSFINLRTKKTGDTLTKFDKVFLAYQDATKKTQQQKEPEPELRDTDLMHMAMDKYFPKKSDQETKTVIADFFDTYIIGKVELLKAKQEIENTRNWKQFQERVINGT